MMSNIESAIQETEISNSSGSQ